MTISALNGRSEPLQHAQGLAASLLLHAMAVGVAVVLIADLQLVPQSDLFKWEVALVEAPPLQQSHHPPTRASTPTQTQADQTPIPSQPSPATHSRIQKTIETRPLVHTVQPVEQVVRQEMVHTRPLAQTSTEHTRQPAVEAPQAISRSPQVIETSETATRVLPAQSTPAPVTDMTPIEKETAVLSTPHEVTAVTKQSISEATPFILSESALVTRASVETTQTSSAVQERVANEKAPAKTESMTVVERTKAVEATIDLPAVKELSVKATSPQQESEIKTSEPFIQQTKISGPPFPELSPAREPPSQSRPAVKADFGWLTRALLSRIEQLKRYPHTARLNHWEGRVILRAVIRDDGELIGVEVTESSGYSELDHDALEIVKKASPLELTHPLGQPQVVVRVPIRYRLEQ